MNWLGAFKHPVSHRHEFNMLHVLKLYVRMRSLLRGGRRGTILARDLFTRVEVQKFKMHAARASCGEATAKSS